MKYNSAGKTLSAITVALALSAAAAHAQPTVQMLPTPMQQGGMVHINLTFLDQPTGTFSSTLDPGIPEMKSLNQWQGFETSVFDAADPWFPTLDPSANNAFFSSRYGFLVDTSASDFLPAGKSIGIRMTSRSTSGLDAYFYSTASGSEKFDPVFLSSGSQDYVLWNGNMWHAVFVASNGTAGPVSAEFEFFLADAAGAGAVDYRTSAGAEPGYATGTATLSFTAVPEPGSVALLLLSGFVLRLRRRSGIWA